MKSPSGSNFLSKTPRNVLLLIITLAANSLTLSYLMIVITAYLPQTGVTTQTIGLVLGAEGLSMAVSAIPFGILSDRKGRKWIIISGVIGAAPLFFIVALTTNVTLLVLGGALAGIFEGAYLATVNAMIADQTELKNRDTVFTLSFILVGGAGAIGSALPLIIPPISEILGISLEAVHSSILLLFGVLSLIFPAVIYLALRGYHETLNLSGKLWRGSSTRSVIKFSLINSLIGLGAGFIMPLIPTWLYLRFAFPDTFSGPALAVASLTIGLAAAFSPRLARRVGSVRAIALTQGLSVMFLVSLAFIGNVSIALGVYIVRTMLMNMSSPLSDSYLMSIIEPDERGLASSINSVIWRIPNSVTTIIGAAILSSGDFTSPFLLAAAFYAAGVPLFYYTFRDVRTNT